MKGKASLNFINIRSEYDVFIISSLHQTQKSSNDVSKIKDFNIDAISDGSLTNIVYFNFGKRY